uniref:Uncharacterized protein n=1 Tax=Solanum tuberosum TaxID=4113 RepID=M1DAC9_SOLTU
MGHGPYVSPWMGAYGIVQVWTTVGPQTIGETTVRGSRVVGPGEFKNHESARRTVGPSTGQNVWVRLRWTTLRVLEEDPNPWPNKLPRLLEVAHGGSMSASRTSSTKGQKFGLRRGQVADSTVSKFNFQKVVRTPPRRKLVSRRNLRK